MKLTKARLKQIIKEELAHALSENKNNRSAGMSIQYQIAKLNPEFKFDKNPPTDLTKLKILQDIGNSNTATIFDANGEVLGTGLDISSAKWKDIVRFGPGLVDQAMDQYKT